MIDDTRLRIDTVLSSIKFWNEAVKTETDLDIKKKYQDHLNEELKKLENFKSRYPEYFI